jgi:hypothetical protein
MKTTHYAITVVLCNTPPTVRGEARLFRRAAYRIFDEIWVSSETVPHRHYHVLAAGRGEPDWECYHRRLGAHTNWHQPLTSVRAIEDYYHYMFALGPHAGKGKNTVPVLFPRALTGWQRVQSCYAHLNASRSPNACFGDEFNIA